MGLSLLLLGLGTHKYLASVIKQACVSVRIAADWETLKLAEILTMNGTAECEVPSNQCFVGRQLGLKAHSGGRARPVESLSQSGRWV